MKNKIYLIGQAVEFLINKAINMKDYGREQEPPGDVVSLLNTLECHIDRKLPITGNALKVTKYKLSKTNLVQSHEPN